MSENVILRRTVLKASAVGCGAIGLAGCVGADASRDTDRGTNEDDSHDVPVPELDLVTLEAETEFGTLRAERADDSYVSSIDDGRAIGIASLDDVGAGENHDFDDGIVVYLYDREHHAIILGELDYAGAARLESEGESHFDATVDLVWEDDAISGRVSFDGDASIPFTADAASGVGGVYWARETDGTDEDRDVSADWVVLPDERQWGCICVMPPMMPEHPCCQMIAVR